MSNCICNGFNGGQTEKPVRKRLGKDIGFIWTITTNGEPLSLEGRILRLVMTDPKGYETEFPFEVQDNKLKTVFYGRDQKWLGVYSFTLWENYGMIGQTAVDKIAVELVRNTYMEG